MSYEHDQMGPAEKMARLVLLFHKPIIEPSDRVFWREITGNDQMTSRALADYARRVIAEETQPNRG